MNVEIGTEVAEFPEKDYRNEIFVALLLLGTFERFPTFLDSLLILQLSFTAEILNKEVQL
jgi:hypothetical protein